MKSFLLSTFVFLLPMASFAKEKLKLHENEISACSKIRTLKALNYIAMTANNYDVDELQDLICAQTEDPKEDLYYNDGTVAFIGAGQQERGSWKYHNGQVAFFGPNSRNYRNWMYPNGRIAFVGPQFQERDSWFYSNGQIAFIGPNYRDRGSWVHPNGRYAFAGQNYSNHGSWFYSNGAYAFVSGNFQDRESWKYPNGRYAFAGPGFMDRDTWYMPNGNVHSRNAFSDNSGEKLTSVVEEYLLKDFDKPQAFDHLPRAVQTLIRLKWIEKELY